jgi:hypothetical protein
MHHKKAPNEYLLTDIKKPVNFLVEAIQEIMAIRLNTI